jgi:membrane protease YdiL (CAAX protease family)
VFERLRAADADARRAKPGVLRSASQPSAAAAGLPRLADLDAVTIDANGTLVGLADPVPRLLDALALRGVARSAAEVASAVEAEFAYYRAHMLEGRDAESLADLHRRCAGVFLAALDAKGWRPRRRPGLRRCAARASLAHARVNDVPVTSRSEGRLLVWLGFVLVFIALQYDARAAASPPPDTFYRWQTFASGLVQFVFTLGIVLAVAWNGPVASFLALRRPVSWRSATKLVLLIFVGIVVLAGLLEPVLHASEEQGFVPERWNSSRALPFAANFVLAAALFPIAEELLFRGAGFAVLARFGRVTAVVAVGVLFGLAHGLVNALPVLAAFGIALTWLRERSHSVLPCIALHAAFNAFALLGAVLA